jgi:two-component system, NtrC family, sensor kinase
MRLVIIILLLFITKNHAYSQHIVKFIVREETAIKHDSIYVAGSFNNWDSLFNHKYLLHQNGNNLKTIVLKLPKGELRYKFHRGNWSSVEKEYNGQEVPDRIINITKDTILIDTIKGWRDELIFDKKVELSKELQDTSRVKILAAIAMIYAFYTEYFNSDSALFYAQQGLQVQQNIMRSASYRSSGRNENITLLIGLQEVIASLLHSLGNYPKALEIRLENLKLAEEGKDKITLLAAINSLTIDYSSMKDFNKMLYYGKLMDSIIPTVNQKNIQFFHQQWNSNNIIANAYYKLNQTDSAIIYAKRNYSSIIGESWSGFNAMTNLQLADIYEAKGNKDSALFFYQSTIPLAENAYAVIAGTHFGLARLYKKLGQADSALYYAQLALTYYQNNPVDLQSWGENSNYYIAEISPFIADLYHLKNQPDSAFKYLRLSVSLKDSLYNAEKIRQFQTLSFNDASRRQQLEQENKLAQQEYNTKIKMFSLIFGILALLILASVFYRSNLQKQKANILLHQQKKEIEATLGILKATQSQLIQSEKMASLGELTAGIAHEIQNPLNFINNFSDVNKELLGEIKDEIDKKNFEEVKLLAKDVIENESKINHHGKRADAIVKGMLQHSRRSNGQKELADINSLANEYLKLAYHGLRARDKSFNATIQTDFDKNIGNINIIPQDIGRVILNLITNAFYAVNEKSLKAKASGDNRYEPTVWVNTKKEEDVFLISVKDNGNGISQKTVEKIFQPFFTTKPTGEGTGLGLSISYDIIKAHGGELKVETRSAEEAAESGKEGTGTIFTIILHNNQN